MTVAAAEADLDSAHNVVDSFTAIMDGITVPNFEIYQVALHESAILNALGIIIRGHQQSEVLDEYGHRHALHIDGGRQEVFAQSVGEPGNELIRIAHHQLPAGPGPKERYRFVGRGPGFGDMAARSWLSHDEVYFARKPSGRPSSPAELTKLLAVARTTFERFASLTRVS